jgi:hypothetical protein
VVVRLNGGNRGFTRKETYRAPQMHTGRGQRAMANTSVAIGGNHRTQKGLDGSPHSIGRLAGGRCLYDVSRCSAAAPCSERTWLELARTRRSSDTTGAAGFLCHHQLLV